MIRSKEKKIVIFGGGTGLSTLVRGLKKFPIDITAVVTVADDGGSSGRLLNEYDIPPPGDVRNVMAALSDVEPLIEKMFQYRFASSESLKGHSLGNLMLAALTNITGDFARAVEQMSHILNIQGKVLPAANQRITLHGELEDGTIVTGESKIPVYGRRIRRVYLTPEEVQPLPETVETIMNADLVVFGPGSLYTSILPTILVRDIRDAVISCSAKKVYICNLTTQAGETLEYTASEHVQALYDHAGEAFIDTVLLNTADFTSLLDLGTYEGPPRPVEHDLEELRKLVPHVVQKDIAVMVDGHIRHKSETVATWLMDYMKTR
ncbi:YvcK family protein [Sporosarcina pasteurii]|uniref:Gluconeogenesis factor n=1 Tax=Sporosarcina pasteurii TaxID=1474 RepID=A0A380CC05_SPOPA|nr:YvcK family protein [Sporosarcina pasteurii]MDS9472688.1 YvcK family protein [Sporosarcina pasteurii]QBQ04347.1 YvcK family protein [Sporosarcina pasteurii]SUJ15793.1 LPPG:FO 2-phospho-L-lactate transferase [Sporosarcina pasteurii]